MVGLLKVSGMPLICSILCLLAACALQAEEVESGLLGHWPLNEGSGNIATDISGNAFNGKYVNTTWNKQSAEPVLEFDGVKSYIVIPHKNELNLKNSLTIEAWIYLDTTDGEISIFNKGSSNFPSGYNFLVENGRLAFYAKTEKFGGDKKDFKKYEIKSDSPVVQIHEWYHVAVVYDSLNNTTILYLDGVPVKKGKAGGPITYIPETETQNAAVSGMSLVPHYPYFHIKGLLKDIKVYRQPLLPKLVSQEYKKYGNLKNSAKPKLQDEIFKDRCTSELNVSISATDRVQPLEAKVYIYDQAGNYYFPENSLNYGDRKKGCFYALEKFSVRLPPGKFQILATRGFEWFPLRKEFSIGNNETKAVKLEMKRMIDMPSSGWYCGEDELQYGAGHGKGTAADHYKKLAGNSMPDGFRNACGICKAEGLNWVNFTTRIKYWNKNWTDEFYKSVDSDTFTARHGLELRGIFGGDIICINSPNATTGKNQYEQLENALGKHAAATLSDGGYDIRNPNAYLTVRLYPVWVILEKVKLWHHALLPLESSPVRDTYKLLNMGFKVSQAAGTDTYMIFSSRMLDIGVPRSYAKLDKLNWNNIAKAYEKQTMFVTDGPLLFFNINQQDMGDTVSIDSRNNKLSCSIKAYSVNGIERVDIIKNGKTVISFNADKGKIEKDFTMDINESCWIAARVFGKKSDEIGGEAHSSPFYIQFEDKKMIPDAGDIEYFRKWVTDIRAIIPDFENNFHDDNKWIYHLLDEADKDLSELQKSPRDWNVKERK